MASKRFLIAFASLAVLLVLAACAAPAAAPAQPAAPAQSDLPPGAPVATEAPGATEAPAAVGEMAQEPASPTAPGARAPQPEVVVTAPAVAEAGETRESPPQATTAPDAPPQPTAAPLPVMPSTSVAAFATATVAPTAETEETESAPAAALAPPTPTLDVQVARQEARVVELEWPPRMRLGESDIVRLALIPSQEGYTLTTEFEDNRTVTQTVIVKRPEGFELHALGRLDGIGFDIAPQAEQRSMLTAGEAVTWRWTISPRQSGQQRLSILVKLSWLPPAGSAATPRESQIYSKGLNVQVDSILGMTTAQASSVGLIGLVLGSGLSAMALVMSRNRRMSTAGAMKAARPNPSLGIEPQPGIHLAEDEMQLLRTLFRRYARVSVEREFRSGYSGARTFLCLPIRADSRADAYTIAKMGERTAIEREFENYETYVKDTLPPITARIQEPPVTLSPVGISSQAVLRYTFIGEQGNMPVSLRESLLADPNPRLLRKLFDTFGPNWWMQRQPYSFRLAQEYDRLLPSHYVLEPLESGARNAQALRPNMPPAEVGLKIGDVVTLNAGDFPLVELRADGASYSLIGEATPGQPPLRLRVQSASQPRKLKPYRVIGTRAALLHSYVAGFDLLGLPDPLDKLAITEHRSISGTRAPIHGDLNLENVLVGPGAFVWLIDFAHTRDGHPLFDFAHLEAEIIAQVIAPQMPSPQGYLHLLRNLEGQDADAHSLSALLLAVHEAAWRCLFNPMQKREYWLALYMACLGALKFSNRDAHQRHLLYLTAAYVAQTF